MMAVMDLLLPCILVMPVVEGSNNCTSNVTFLPSEPPLPGYELSELCVNCTIGCPSGQWVGIDCNVTADTVCRDCTICSEDEVTVNPCTNRGDAKCVKAVYTLYGELIFGEAVATTLLQQYQEQFNKEVESLLKSAFPVNDSQRVINVTTSMSSGKVVTKFSLLPDLVYWDTICYGSSNLVVLNFTQDS